MTREFEIAAIAVFAAFIAVLGLVPKLELQSGVPVTAQSLGVMLAGTILGAKRGFLAVLLFVSLVAIGLPLLPGGRGGLGVFVGPTAGFIIGFPIAALVTGWFTARLKAQPMFWAAFLGSILGAIFVLYALGIVGYAIIAQIGIWPATLTMWVFIPWDIVKAVIAGLITSVLFKYRPEWVLTR